MPLASRIQQSRDRRQLELKTIDTAEAQRTQRLLRNGMALFLCGPCVLWDDLIRFMRQFDMPIPSELNKPLPFVLIVDDEIDMIDLLTAVLQSGDEEFDVAGAQGGVEAFLIIGERKPDLLVLDIMMPGMNGIEICGQLKANSVTRKIRIVAMSGQHDSAVRDRILAAGADRFFVKPFNMAEFRSECVELIHSPGAR